MKSAIDRIAFRGLEPSGVVLVAPNHSQPDMWVGLHQLCYGQHAKHGCYLVVESYYVQFAQGYVLPMSSSNGKLQFQSDSWLSFALQLSLSSWLHLGHPHAEHPLHQLWLLQGTFEGEVLPRRLFEGSWGLLHPVCGWVHERLGVSGYRWNHRFHGN